MFNNNKYNFGVFKVAQIRRVADDSFVKNIEIAFDDGVYENASYVGGGIASEGRRLVVYAYDNVDDLEPYMYQVVIDNTVYIIVDKQKQFLQHKKRYSIKREKEQTILTLE